MSPQIKRNLTASTSISSHIDGCPILTTTTLFRSTPSYSNLRSLSSSFSWFSTTTTTTTTTNNNEEKVSPNDPDVVNENVIPKKNTNSDVESSIVDDNDHNDDDDDDKVKNKSNENDPTNVPTLKLFPVYTRYDLEDLLNNTNRNILTSEQYKEDLSIAIHASFDLDNIQQQLQQQFGTYKDLQYYCDIQSKWVPLQTQEHVNALRTSLETLPHQYNRLVAIKVPKYFDEFSNDPDDDTNPYAADDDDDDYSNDNNNKKKNINKDFDDPNHPTNIMNDDGTIPIEDTSTSEFMKQLPTVQKEGTNKQDQVLIQLAQVVERVIQKFGQNSNKYEKLYPYTTSRESQRLVLKSKQHFQTKTTTTTTTTDIDNASTTTTTTKARTVQDSLEEVEIVQKIIEPTSDSEPISTTTTALEEDTKQKHNEINVEKYYEDDGYSIDTRVYIMQLAASKKDPVLANDLRNVIMSYPHALDHIAHCIHLFDFNSSNNNNNNTSNSSNDSSTSPPGENTNDEELDKDTTNLDDMSATMTMPSIGFQ